MSELIATENPEFPLDEIKTVIEIVKSKAYLLRLKELISCVNVISKFVTEVFYTSPPQPLIVGAPVSSDDEMAAALEADPKMILDPTMLFWILGLLLKAFI